MSDASDKPDFYYDLDSWEYTTEDLDDLVPVGEIVHVGMLKKLPNKFAVLIGQNIKLFDTRDEAHAALDANAREGSPS